MKHLPGTSVIILSLLGVCSLVMNGQTATVKQKSEKSICSNVVALAGDVHIDCASLTSAQRKAISGIPNIMKKILASQLDIAAVSAKLDELISRPSDGPQNSAPGGYAISGGTVINPGIYHFAPGLPEIEASTPQPTRADQNSPQFPGDPARNLKPGVSVYIAVKSPFATPAFEADCNVPCKVTDFYYVKDMSSVEDSRDYQIIGSTDYLRAGVVLTKSLLPGETISLVFRPLSNKPLTISNVRPIALQ